MHKTTTLEVRIGDLAEVKAAIEQLQRDNDELLEALANSPHTVATWINDAAFEYAEGWAGFLRPEAGGDCSSGHYCCDGYSVSRRVMDMLARHNADVTAEFEITNESTVSSEDVEAWGQRQPGTRCAGGDCDGIEMW